MNTIDALVGQVHYFGLPSSNGVVSVSCAALDGGANFIPTGPMKTTDNRLLQRQDGTVAGFPATMLWNTWKPRRRSHVRFVPDRCKAERLEIHSGPLAGHWTFHPNTGRASGHIKA